VSAAGHYQQRFALAVEHQAVGDRTDLAAKLLRGSDRRFCVGAEDLDVGLDAGGGHGGGHPGIPFVHVS
jgi:hypothetical protein